MAANFWTSSHYKQLFDQEEVDMVHPLDKEKGITLEDFKIIKTQMTIYISILAQQVKVRQRVVATAVAYMRRVYTRCNSKADALPRKQPVDFRPNDSDEKYRYEIKEIFEMEMKILEALNFYLVVFHPYRSLPQFLQDAGINDINMTQLTWGLVNDTYKMDLILVHPPHIIALACIYIASVYREKDSTAWFEELRVDMNVVSSKLQLL
ncbi:hypothetical protein POTOM_048837 [Populus tomentosa]|uniref:Uncharacterized protein n=1 Tax=Populus tomentosa TaxID=118781 RepID=A0A8X8CDI1_POPTO|nr:hypothetical protein POTOM_048837 [Populus tomentosa]